MSNELATERSLLNPRADFLMIAGASILMLAGFHLWVPQSQDIQSISWIMYYLAFLVNYPHFMLSYQILYIDQRNHILKKPSYFWAAVICPTILLGFVIWGFNQSVPTIFPILVQAMFITVGWHYVKQIFGTMVVASAQKKFFFSPPEKWSLLVNLYSLAVLSFVSGQRSSSMSDFYGIKYNLWGLPNWSFHVSCAIVFLTLVVFLLLSLKRYIDTGETASKWAWVSLVGIYTWYIPVMYHPHFFLMIPFFHSMQYLLFVIALKRNTWIRNAPARADAKTLRKYHFKKWTLYFAPPIALGVLCFWGLPSLADAYLQFAEPQKSLLWGTSIFVGIFNLFINLHHYFVDNVIWRRDNEQLKEALFR